MTAHYPYLIIGGGMTADAAARGIRQVDPNTPIGLIGEELDPPYNRPPLSKGMWKRIRPTPVTRIDRNTASLGVEMHLGRRVVQIDPAQRQLFDQSGEVFSYDKLLLATGGEPIRLGLEHERVITFRTLEDYRRLRVLTDSAQRFLIIGGGFIGSEMAAAMAAQGKDVSIIFPEIGIGARVLPEEISTHLNEKFTGQGVRILHGELVQALQPDAKGVTLQTASGETLRADGVVAGLGIRPNTALAKAAGLETGNGILVDAAMRTSYPHIYAAGDVANFYSPALGQRMRVEHEENANLTGQLAGQAMAGAPGRYDTLPSVYSTLFDATYDAVGELNPALDIIYDWAEPFQKGAVYYMREGRVRGVLLWNLAKGLDIARQMISEAAVLSGADLKGRIQS